MHASARRSCNARLRKLAAALGPAYVRVSGTWANSVFFQDTDAQPEAYIGGADKLFNANGKLVNDGTRNFLQRFMQAYAEWIGATIDYASATKNALPVNNA